MDLLLAVLLVLGGLLSASPAIVARRPDAGRALARLRRFQAAIGVGLLVIGVLVLVFHTLPGLLVLPLPAVVANLVTVVLGFFLAFPWIRGTFLAGRTDLADRGEEWRDRLGRIQVPLGIAALVVAVYVLLA